MTDPHPFTTSILQKILAEIEKAMPLPSANAEFQVGFIEAKSDIIKRIKEKQWQ